MSNPKMLKNGKIKFSSGYSANEDKKISFSFKYLTSNKKYNFDFFSSSNFREKGRAYDDLHTLLDLLSGKSKLNLISLKREEPGGNEKIPAKELKFVPHDYTFDSDEFVRSFRFSKKNDYRLIGLWEDSVLQIIGYDFDHSAYDHG